MPDDPTRTINPPSTDFPAGKAPSGRPAAGNPENGGSPRLTYRDLAWWAETADGYRDEELVVAEVEENGRLKRIVKQKKAAQDDGNRILLDGIYTGMEERPSRPPADEVTVTVNGKQIKCRSKEGVVCDSIFCTDSAMEKFLFPYYHSQRLLTPEQWEKLKKAFLDPFVIVIGHVWPSRAIKFGDTGDGVDAFYVLSKARMGEGAKWESLGEYAR